jgi:phosphocarrier protein
MTTARQRVTVTHEKGLHARPASAFVQTAASFDAEVRVGRPGADETADATSSIAVLSLGIEPGDEIEIAGDGPEGTDAVERLVELVEGDFELDD